MREKAILSLVSLLSFASILNGERQNYRQVWQSWSQYQQDIYLWGFKDGAQSSLALATAALPQGLWTSGEPGATISASGQEFLKRFGERGNVQRQVLFPMDDN